MNAGPAVIGHHEHQGLVVVEAAGARSEGGAGFQPIAGAESLRRERSLAIARKSRPPSTAAPRAATATIAVVGQDAEATARPDGEDGLWGGDGRPGVLDA